MKTEELPDTVLRLLTLAVSTLSSDFPLYSYIQTALSNITEPHGICDASPVNLYLQSSETSGSLIALCVEILLSRDTPLPLLQTSCEALLLIFRSASKQDASGAIVSLVEAALNRKLGISTTRLVLSLFSEVIRNNLHSGLLISNRNNERRTLWDEFSFEIVHLCVLSKLALTDASLDIGLVIYVEDLQTSGICVHTLLFFTTLLMLHLSPNSELSRSPFYASLSSSLPGWIPKRFLEGFEPTSILCLIRETLFALTKRIQELKSFLAENSMFVNGFVVKMTAIACSCNEWYGMLRQAAVDCITLFMELFETTENLESPTCVTLFHCFNCLVLLPLIPTSPIFANLESYLVPKAVGQLVLSEAYGCLPEDAKADLKKQRDARLKDISAQTSGRVSRNSKILMERAHFCLCAFLRVIRGNTCRLYPIYLMRLTHLPSSPLLFYVVLDVFASLARADKQSVSNLALTCFLQLRLHCLSVLLWGFDRLTQIPSILFVQNKILSNMTFLGAVKTVSASIVDATRGKAIREAKPDVLINAIVPHLTNTARDAFYSQPSTILFLLSGIVPSSVPFALLFSKQKDDQSGSQSEITAEGDPPENMTKQEQYFYLILKASDICIEHDELDLFRLCFTNFLLSGEGQEIERAMIACANAVSRIIKELPDAHRCLLLDNAPALQILLGSIVVLTTEYLSEKIPLASKMTEARFVSILMGASNIKEYLSENYQLHEKDSRCKALLYDDLVSKFKSMYRRVRNAPLAVDRTIYDTVMLQRGIFLPASLCLQMAQQPPSPATGVGAKRIGIHPFCNVFRDGYAMSSMLPGTVDQFIHMTVHQTILHRRLEGQLRGLFASLASNKSSLEPECSPQGDSPGEIVPDEECNADSFINTYLQMHILLQASWTHFASSILTDANSLALTVNCSLGLFDAIHEYQKYFIRVLPAFELSRNRRIVAGLLERELVSASYLTRYYADQCGYLCLSEYMSTASVNAWTGIYTKIRENPTNHIYAGLYGINLSTILRCSAHGTNKWRTKSMNDTVSHAVHTLITLYALNILGTQAFIVDFNYQLFPRFNPAGCPLNPLKFLQSLPTLFSSAEELLANKLLMCPIEICKGVVSAYEKNTDYSLIIHTHMIELLIRGATPEGLDAKDSSLVRHTTKVHVVYASLMLLGSLEFCIDIVPFASIQSLLLCLPELISLVELALKTVRTHTDSINSHLQPIYTRLNPGQGVYNLATAIEVLVFSLQMLLFGRIASDIKMDLTHSSNLILLYNQMKKQAYSVATARFVSQAMLSTMETTHAKLDGIEIPVTDATTGTVQGNLSQLYAQLCLSIIYQCTSVTVFWDTTLECIQNIFELLASTSKGNILTAIFLSPLREFQSKNFILLASHLLQLFHGKTVSSKVLTIQRTITIAIDRKSEVLTLPALTSFFFEGLHVSESPEEKVEEGSSNSLFSKVASVFFPRNTRESVVPCTKPTIGKASLEKFAKFLTEISTSELLKNPTARFISELGAENYPILSTQDVVSQELMAIYFALSISDYISRMGTITSDTFLSLPSYTLMDVQPAQTTAPKLALPLLLPLFLITRTLEGTSVQAVRDTAIKALGFLVREYGTSDESAAFLFQQICLPILLLSQSSVPLTPFENYLTKASNLTVKIAELAKELLASLQNPDVKASLEKQLATLHPA